MRRLHKRSSMLHMCCGYYICIYIYSKSKTAINISSPLCCVRGIPLFYLHTLKTHVSGKYKRLLLLCYRYSISVCKYVRTYIQTYMYLLYIYWFEEWALPMSKIQSFYI